MPYKFLFLFSYYFLTNIHYGFSQKNDYIWVLGNNAGANEQTINNDTLKLFTPFNFNFNADPMRIEYFPKRQLRFRGTCGLYCKDNGEYFCSSNGMFVSGVNDAVMQGGDSINFGAYWLQRYDPINGIRYGHNLFQGSLFLPIKSTEGKDLLYLFSSFFDY